MCAYLTKADFFYETAFGRGLLKLIQAAGGFRVAAWFLHTGLSRHLIPGYIRKNDIDMTPYEGQTYHCFAEFFARERRSTQFALDTDTLISPCDGRLTVYPVSENLTIPMKGSHYHLRDLIPDDGVANVFHDGLCLVFRLEASDYHHFCGFDDMMMVETRFVPGLLHSVQPIACQTVPVYRLNRRWWSLLETVHFGLAAQIEVGAMVVGDVQFPQKSGWLYRGDEMGHFELSGSTIVLFLASDVRRRLHLMEPFEKTWGGASEAVVHMGEGIGKLCHEEQNR